MSCNIYSNLVSLGLASDETAELFAEGTRDCASVKVWRDSRSGVIFIKDYYIGHKSYRAGGAETPEYNAIKRSSFEDANDCTRRVNDFRAMYYDKTVCELGFGSGEFMRAVSPFCETISGVELSAEQLLRLSEKGFPVEEDLCQFGEQTFDSVFLFHTFEHFPDPLIKLEQIKKSLKNGGKVVIEVPHARDFLLRDDMACDAFKSHTLWSQHLILHTRHSLGVMLGACGFKDILVRGVQRYPLSNHFQWLARGEPGGHMSNISSIDTAFLTDAYQTSLAKIDATDTIIAVATAR